jgi:ketosteroid isomerase-like protein
VPKYTAPPVLAADSVSAVTAFQKLRAAMHSGDTVAFVSLFAPDAMVMTPKGELIPFAEYRKVRLPGMSSFMHALTVDRDSLTRVSVSRETAWVGASSAASGRVDGSFVHVYLESLALMRKTPDGWRVVVLQTASR